MRANKIVFLFLVSLFASCKKDSDSTALSGSVLHPLNVNANSFLSSTSYDKLIIEIQYVNGSEPSGTTINNVVSFLQAQLNKPGGITVVQKAVTSPGKSIYSLADISDFEAHNRTQLTKDRTLTAYVFFADGDYSETANSSSKVLGIAYQIGAVAIFERTIKSFSGGLTQPPTTTLETTVLEHEFGHLLGLVNNGSAMQAQHQDTAHGSHCSNTNCMMYYQAETSDVIANLTGGAIPALDANCNNDLKANGGK